MRRFYIWKKNNSYERRMKKPKKFYNSPRSEECWNVDLAFVEFMIPRLKLFKEDASKMIVYDFTIIDRILEGFELYKNKYDWTPENCEENYAKFLASMELFKDNIIDFWW